MKLFRTALLVLLASSANATAMAEDLIDIPIKQLLEMEVITANKVARQVSDSPSAVSIVTAQDIHDFGYRTLADVLNSMRGLNVTSDSVYDFLGGRGFGAPGDYTGRIMIMIDGVQTNDNFYNQAYIGTDGLLDVELIDRVEYVPGPGSVAYGNNAFYGIINIVTKKGNVIGGTEASVAGGSHDSRKARLTHGKAFDNGIDLLVSASGFDSNGRNIYLPEYDDGDPAHANGRSRNLDSQRNRRLFGKLQGNSWQVETGYSSRHKDIPTAPYGSDFNVGQFYEDTSKFLTGQYHFDLDSGLKLSLQADYADYFYFGSSPYSGIPFIEKTSGRYWDMDAKLAITRIQEHHIILGASYRSDYERKLVSNAPYLTDKAQENFSLYAQDEISLRNNWALNLGLRYDRTSDNGGSALSPRAALIYRPEPQLTLKLSHSYANRTPTAFEKYYSDGGKSQPNLALDREYVQATEFIAEKRWGQHARLMASVYHQLTEDPISSQPYRAAVIQFLNGSHTSTRGLELEYEHNWKFGTRLRTSYSYQHAEDEHNNWPINIPRQLGKINLSMPLPGNMVRAGFEAQSVSRRRAWNGEELSGFTIANLTLTSNKLIPNLDISFSARNLFDKHYRFAAPDYNDPIVSIEQDGRNYWLQFTYSFR